MAGWQTKTKIEMKVLPDGYREGNARELFFVECSLCFSILAGKKIIFLGDWILFSFLFLETTAVFMQGLLLFGSEQHFVEGF